MNNKRDKTIKNERRAEDYLDPETKKFKEGNPGGGRPAETEEDKIIKEVRKKLVKSYIDKLASALPAISPVLIALAIGGDLKAIKEINDRVLGSPQQRTDITSDDKPLPLIQLPVTAEYGVKPPEEEEEETIDLEENPEEEKPQEPVMEIDKPINRELLEKAKPPPANIKNVGDSYKQTQKEIWLEKRLGLRNREQSR